MTIRHKSARRFPRFCTAAALALVSAAGLSSRLHAAPPAGYTLVWSEEFNEGVGNQPSSTLWNWEVGNIGASNGELENYVSDVAHSHIISDANATDGQALQIQATNTNGYESARMTTQGKKTFQYGFIEARIKLPYGQGIWPAFWMLGANYPTAGWPGCGEMDIMENIGNRQWYGENESSLHGPGYSGANSLHAYYNLPRGQTFHDGYHLFQMLWQQDSVQYFVDGNLFETRTPADTNGNPWVFNNPMFFIMNVAIGGYWPGSPNKTTTWPQNMLVDYIRVYQ
jgi:beta-glucanase (GH16 family)